MARGFDDPRRMITWIIGINAAMYVLTLILGPRSSNPLSIFSVDTVSLLSLGATGSYPVVQHGKWWTLLSANYLHGGIIHILFNMLAFRQLAALTAREYGTHRTFLIYSFGGIAGFAVSCAADVYLTIGASGAVCALMGALIYYGKSRGGSYGRIIYQQVVGWAIGLVLFGFMVKGINNWAHGGGMVAGALLGYLLGYTERRQEGPVHRRLAVGVAIGTMATLAFTIVTGIMNQF